MIGLCAVVVMLTVVVGVLLCEGVLLLPGDPRRQVKEAEAEMRAAGLAVKTREYAVQLKQLKHSEALMDMQINAAYDELAEQARKAAAKQLGME